MCRELFDKYAGCANSGEVVAAQNEYLRLLDQEQEERARAKLAPAAKRGDDSGARSCGSGRELLFCSLRARWWKSTQMTRATCFAIRTTWRTKRDQWISTRMRTEQTADLFCKHSV